MLSALLAMASALVFGAGVALQQRAAREVPQEYALRPGLLLRLLRRPRWLAGLGCDVGGFAFQAAALATGPLLLVQIILTTDVLFTLTLVAGWTPGDQLGRREWVGVAASVGGIAAFLLATEPVGGDVRGAGTLGWVLCTGSVTVLVTACVLASRRNGPHSSGRARAGWLGAASGLANAFLAVLAKALVDRLDAGVGATMGSWEPYALVAAGLVTLLLVQSAYQAGHPSIVLPIFNVVDPLASAAVALGLFGEHILLDGWRGPVAGVALAVMGFGLVRLARTPMVLAAHEAVTA